MLWAAEKHLMVGYGMKLYNYSSVNLYDINVLIYKGYRVN